MDSTAAETYVRLLAERELRRAVPSPSYRWLDHDLAVRGLPRPRDEEGYLRVAAVLSALRSAGALTGEAAEFLHSSLAGAFAARGLTTPRALLNVPVPGGQGTAPSFPAVADPARSAPPGRYRAIPVGAVLPADLGDRPGLVYLQTLVLAPDRAAITMTHLWTPEAPGAAAAGQPRFPPFGSSGLTDDRGRPYGLTFRTGDSSWHESGTLDLSAIPPPGTRWLDVPTGPGSTLRISLAGPAPAVELRTEPVAPAPVGELLLDAVAETLLGGGPMPGTQAHHLAAGLAEVVDALEAAGAMPSGSPAADRLAALCQRRAIRVRGKLAARGGVAVLPATWSSVLARVRCEDGPEGVVNAAVALPEIDGTRIVLAGLVSWERLVRLTGFAWGWQPHGRTFRAQQPLSWWARDDCGRWHVGRAASAEDEDTDAFQVELTPPLHPDATALDVIVTSRSRRVTATIPLTWLQPPAGRADGHDISC